MRTILMSAYAVNPLKGSEDGLGWNYIYQAARYNNIIAVTRKNNRPAIEKYMTDTYEDNEVVYDRISFLYFDWPRWMIFWKKGPMLSMIYYYFWQLTLAIWLKVKNVKCDVAHNLNFHNDWTPSFLWMVNKNFVWGPVGHHPRIPREFTRRYGWKTLLKDRTLWALKWCFWNLDPLLFITKRMAMNTWCMHQPSANRLKPHNRFFVYPSVASKPAKCTITPQEKFTVLSAGRFVSLKGFDITIRSFASFYKRLSDDQKSLTELVLVGRGPQQSKLQALAQAEGIEHVTRFISWMPQSELQNVYKTSSVFFFPSHEGAGLVVAEAMSYGLPVVCWDNCGPGTTVHPGSSLKVPYGDYNKSIDAFAGKLQLLMNDQLFYKTECRLAAYRFATALSWDVKGAQLDTLYDAVPHKQHLKLAI